MLNYPQVGYYGCCQPFHSRISLYAQVTKAHQATSMLVRNCNLKTCDKIQISFPSSSSSSLSSIKKPLKCLNRIGAGDSPNSPEGCVGCASKSIGLSPRGRQGVGGIMISSLAGEPSGVVDSTSSPTSSLPSNPLLPKSTLSSLSAPFSSNNDATDCKWSTRQLAVLSPIASSLYTVLDQSHLSHGQTKPASSQGQVCVSSYSSSAKAREIRAPAHREPTYNIQCLV
mgnify:CR=1 FL=1